MLVSFAISEPPPQQRFHPTPSSTQYHHRHHHRSATVGTIATSTASATVITIATITAQPPSPPAPCNSVIGHRGGDMVVHVFLVAHTAIYIGVKGASPVLAIPAVGKAYIKCELKVCDSKKSATVKWRISFDLVAQVMLDVGVSLFIRLALSLRLILQPRAV